MYDFLSFISCIYLSAQFIVFYISLQKWLLHSLENSRYCLDYSFKSYALCRKFLNLSKGLSRGIRFSLTKSIFIALQLNVKAFLEFHEPTRIFFGCRAGYYLISWSSQIADFFGTYLYNICNCMDLSYSYSYL